MKCESINLCFNKYEISAVNFKIVLLAFLNFVVPTEDHCTVCSVDLGSPLKILPRAAHAHVQMTICRVALRHRNLLEYYVN